MKLAISLGAVFLALTMAVTQHFAFEYYWYWTYPWLDSVMHLMGGLVIGLLLALVGVRRMALIVFGVVVVGILWEVFEYAIGISIAEPNFISDTILDLTMDLIGALLACGIIRLWPLSASPLSAARDASPDQTSSSLS